MRLDDEIGMGGVANRARVLAARAERAEAVAKLAPVPAASARRRVRVALAVGVGGPVALIIAIGLMVRLLNLNQGWMALSPVFGSIALYTPMSLLFGTPVDGPKGQRSDLLTFRTLAGRRTLDLSRLTRVRRLVIPSRGEWYNGLVLTDQYGVRVAVADARIIDEVTGLVARQRAGSLSRRPLIVCSSSAAVRMGFEQRSPGIRAARTFLLVAGLLTSSIAAWFAGVFLALAVSGQKYPQIAPARSG